jgi:hypothetical protein
MARKLTLLSNCFDYASCPYFFSLDALHYPIFLLLFHSRFHLIL